MTTRVRSQWTAVLLVKLTLCIFKILVLHTYIVDLDLSCVISFIDTIVIVIFSVYKWADSLINYPSGVEWDQYQICEFTTITISQIFLACTIRPSRS